MNLVSLRLITDDVTGMTDFYEKVTQVVAVRQGDVFAELRTPSGTLAIGSTKTVAMFGPGSARAGANHTAIVEFLVEDVDAEFERLRGWLDRKIVTEPTTMPWGNRSMLFRDPDGTLVNLFSPATAEAVKKFASYER